jgi:CheY-like chemotaxis protein
MARILFVDDDPMTLETMTKAVTLFGHQALVASGARQGIQLAIQEKPDLIFSDMRLVDMDGLELVKVLKSLPETASIPVLILSASPMMNAEQIAIEVGASAYLTKPIRLQTLLDTIQEYTDQANATT